MVCQVFMRTLILMAPNRPVLPMTTRPWVLRAIPIIICIINSMVKSAIYTGLIGQITSNGKATNCTRRSRVLLTLPVLVTSAINPYCTSNHTIDC